MTLTWEFFAELVLKVGLPLAVKIARLWIDGKPPSAADLAELDRMANESPKELVTQIIRRSGADPASPAAVAFLALLPA